jgi:hypothetical protein
MKPVMSYMRHDPANNQVGDCMRACFASLLELELDAVPHFAFGERDPEVVWQNIAAFLASHHLAAVTFNVPGNVPAQAVLDMMGLTNPNVYYGFIGFANTADHMVIGLGAEIVHDPSWLKIGIHGPASNGVYQIIILTPCYAA